MVELRALGSIDLRRDGTEISAVLTQSKRIALLLYLDIARPRGFHRRDRLVGLLWPELDDTHSRNALSKAIHHIRRELGLDPDGPVLRTISPGTISAEMSKRTCFRRSPSPK